MLDGRTKQRIKKRSPVKSHDIEQLSNCILDDSYRLFRFCSDNPVNDTIRIPEPEWKSHPVRSGCHSPSPDLPSQQRLRPRVPPPKSDSYR